MSAPIGRLGAALEGRYRLERELGQGGMATVYLAQDLKHDRQVAVKVLRPELAAVIGAERFLAEIKTTANLQHPHILALFDSGQVDGTVFYAMPFVEGESLRDRLAREKQLPLADALKIATEVASALDYAHRHGVIHRDIKPENILLHDGSALVADFGIALAASRSEGATRMTETGMSLGTPHYMSPEQAMGERDLDARTDVYALGCMLYEMLAGETPFNGPTAQAIIAKVMASEPEPVTTLRRTVPPHVAAAVHTAIQRLPADRFETAARFAEALANPAARIAYPAPPATAGFAGMSRRATGVLVTGLSAAVVVLGALALRGRLRPDEPRPLARFKVEITGFQTVEDYDPVISPDGSMIVMANATGSLQLRHLDRLATTTVPGTDNAWSPAFSPDGRRIAFATGYPGALRYVTLGGGNPVTLVPGGVFGYGVAWSSDGWLYYSGESAAGLELRRVREDGSGAEVLATPDPARDELFFVTPSVLDDGSAVLFTIWHRTGAAEIGALDLRTRRVTVVGPGNRALVANKGLVAVSLSDGSLTAGPFDPRRLTFTSPPVVVETGLNPGTGFSVGAFSLSRDGMLVFLTEFPPQDMVRVGRDGSMTTLSAGWPVGDYRSVRLSPDGTRLAYSVFAKERRELWVRDLVTGAATRLAAMGRYAYRPSWTADGRSVAFISDAGGRSGAYLVPADGSGPPKPLVHSDQAVDEVELSRDGIWMVYRRGSGGGRELFARRLVGDTTTVNLLDTGSEEFAPALSPDGKWLAYASWESGEDEVYVRRFDNPGGGRWQISRGGGNEPRWSPSGREVLYRRSESEIVAVSVTPGASFAVGGETTLRLAGRFKIENRNASYDVGPDGSLITIRMPAGGSPDFQLTTNWFEAVARRLDGRDPPPGPRP